MIATPSYSIPKGVNSGAFGIFSSKYCKELDNVIDFAKSKQYIIPTEYQLNCLNIFILEMKSAGIWDRLDLIYIFGYNHPTYFNNELNLQKYNEGLLNFCLINLINPEKYHGERTSTNTDFAPYNTKKGLRGLPTAPVGHINTNYVYDVNYQRNDAGISCYNAVTATTNNNVFGRRDTTALRRDQIGMAFGGRNLIGNINTADVVPGELNTTLVYEGFHRVERTASNLTTYYLNGVQVGTHTTASQTQTSTIPFYLGSLNQAGTAAQRYTPVMSCVSIGGALGEKQLNEYQIFTDFRTKLGY
jgi:hypothetical protein